METQVKAHQLYPSRVRSSCHLLTRQSLPLAQNCPGDDNFVVRSFAALRLLDDGETPDANETFPNVTVHVCNKTQLEDQEFLKEYAEENNGEEYTCGNNNVGVEPPANPDYIVNSLVDIDGGTGNDRLTIVGTEVCMIKVACFMYTGNKAQWFNVLPSA